MLRKLFTAVSVVELLAPNALVDAAERLTLDNPGESQLRPWVIPIARLEGLLFLAMLRRSDRAYSRFKKLLGAMGLFVSLRPATYREYGARMAYSDASALEWKPWVDGFTRLVGLLYVLVGLRELRRS